MHKKEPEKIKLESAFGELEKITQALQSGNLDIEPALEKYEQGMALAEKIRTRLNELENRMEKIRAKFSSNEPAEHED